MKSMIKIVCVASLFVVPFISFAQEVLTGKKWRSSTRLFEDTTVKTYAFEAVDQMADWSKRWGYFLMFNEDGTFETDYSAPCGMDCFTQVKGTYVDDGQELRLTIKEIIRDGLCSKESETFEEHELVFQFSLKKGLTLELL